ncbi:MAG: hypothetical protein MUE33_04030 [Cytophagaceae bacterium]|nr:hypothetical protein [Cytophagaceae bacterium]
MKQLFHEQSGLNSLTEILGTCEFSETRPYLTRRKLTPHDKRFTSIELVYETPKEVRKICWYLDVTISELIDYFGEPRFHYSPHGSATLIGFFDSENQFTGFETMYSGSVREKKGKYECYSEDGKFEIKENLKVSYISYDIETMKNKREIPTTKVDNKIPNWLKKLWA